MERLNSLSKQLNSNIHFNSANIAGNNDVVLFEEPKFNPIEARFPLEKRGILPQCDLCRLAYNEIEELEVTIPNHFNDHDLGLLNNLIASYESLEALSISIENTAPNHILTKLIFGLEHCDKFIEVALTSTRDLEQDLVNAFFASFKNLDNDSDYSSGISSSSSDSDSSSDSSDSDYDNFDLPPIPLSRATTATSESE